MQKNPGTLRAGVRHPFRYNAGRQCPRILSALACFVLSASVYAATGVNTPEPDGTTPLMRAVRENKTAEIDRLIRAGADVKTANRYGVTALSLASLNGDAAVIEKLLKAGADPNATGAEGETPLMTVAHSGNVDAAKV